MTSARTQRRDKKRTAEQLTVLAAARALEDAVKPVIERFPRFGDPINKAVAFIRAQNQSSRTKQSHIQRLLQACPHQLDELCAATGLDRVSVKAELARMMNKNMVEMCDRNGNAIVLRSNGRPNQTPVYRLKP